VQIAGWHLFGVAGGEKPVEKKAVEAPETRLKLTLRGVFASEESTAGRAIVGDPKGKEETYAVGDPLPGGAKLSEIYPDRIILERNGRFETLRLPKELTHPQSVKAGNLSAPQAGSVSSSGKAAAFQKYRKEIKQNPSSFMNYVRAAPYREDGKFVGFRLQAGRQPDAFNQLGLQSGDIVTAINGVQIDSPSTGMKAMRALGDGDSVNVTLLRGGQETSLSLSLP
jgi:general secretion pathway protein C